jgi:hypothetical protein
LAREQKINIFVINTRPFCCEKVSNNSRSCRKGLKEQFGITVSFIATHTGLTRWHDFPLGVDPEDASIEGLVSSKPFFFNLHHFSK